MGNLKIFENKEFGSIRTVEIDGAPWFVGKDIAEVLGYARTADAIRVHVDDEDKGVCKTPTPSGDQNMTIINESGLYSLIISSKLPTAKQFKRWVTSEVLPSIRKTGAYAIQGGQPSYQISDPIERAKKWIEEETIRQEQAKQLEVQKPKADYYDGLVERGNNLNFRDTAKLLGIGEKAFIFMLIDKKYIYRDAKGKLKPIAQYVGKYFELKEWTTNDKSGTQTLITVKGRERFAELIKELKEGKE